MKRLFLTKEEREAIDWVGYRYSNGDDLYKLLLDCEWEAGDWGSEEDLVIAVREDIQEEIRAIYSEQDNCFPCFVDSLTKKLLFE